MLVFPAMSVPPTAFVPPVRNPRGSVADAVHEALQRAIVSGELTPGTALSEVELATRFGVSRTPVREAIGRLTEDGLVVVVPQVGTFVGRIRLQDVTDGQFVRETLEAEAVRLAAEQGATKAQLAELRGFLDAQRLAAAAVDAERFFEADEGLHAAVFAIAGQAGAWRFLRAVKLHMDRVRRLSLPDRATLEALLDEHTRLVDAIEARSPDAAQAVLREHARRVLVYSPALAERYPDRFA